MSFSFYGLLYVLTVPVFFLIDMTWLGFVAQRVYQSQIGFLLGPVNWPAAIIFYLLYIVGIIIFAVTPAIHGQSWTTALLYGALFGFFAYGTYDLTNLATVKDWPLMITLIDMTWGVVLTGSVATASYLISTFLH